MEQLLLKDMCAFANGKAHEQFVDEKGNYILITSKFIASDGELFRRTNDRLMPLEIGDLCMVMSDVPNGRALAKCFLVDKNDIYTLNQRIGVFKADDRFLKKYFYYQMNRNKYFLSFDDGDSQTNLRKDDILNCPMICPSKAEQQVIVNILDRVSSVIKKRQKELLDLDELIKARFVELFGDPVENPYGYEKVALSELADIKIGPFGSLLHKDDYIENGHALLNPSHIIDGKVAPDTKLTISDEKYDELSAYQLRPGDVVMGRRGEMGRCAVVPDEGFLCGTGSLMIRTKGEVTADFIQKIISFPTFKKTIEDMAVGQTMPNLNVPIVSGFMIIKPPLEIQNQYYGFIDQVDKSKFAVQKSLDETQLLFDSLMQEYFG